MGIKINPFTGQFDLVGTTGGGGGSGDVNGPGSSVDGNIVIFDGTTGKVIADSGIAIDSIPNYGQTFVIADWTLSVDTYSLVIPKATHGKDNPIILVYEADGANFIQVETGVRIDASENVTLTINATPDLRFDGKLVIS